jgi:energy-coupling factor transport system ATP-binding protein
LDLRLDNVSHVYRSPFFTEHRALEGVSLRFRSGDRAAVVGASGSGKTTLLQHLNGILQPSSGRVLVDGRDMAAPGTDLAGVRARVGIVFQFPESQLFEETVYRDVSFGPRHLGFGSNETDRRVRAALDTVGLDFEAFRDRLPFHLSGGEKRRAAIAGVLAMEPEVLALDEPTAGLDFNSGGRIESILLRLNAAGKTVVFVSHDMDLVARLASHVVVLIGGRLRFDGAPEDLFRNPAVLEEAGLELPQVTRTMNAFADRGILVRRDVYTIEAAKEEIRRAGGINHHRPL